MPPKALEGIKVLEWSQMVAGPFCARLLADLGAETVKVEPPGKGDEARSRPPFHQATPHPEKSGLFMYLNTNKRGVTLGLDSPEGRELFRKLVAWADILVEDNPPPKVRSLGLDYENLKKVNPRLIMASITPFGQTGPHRDYKAYPLNTFHSGGEGFMTPSGTAFPHRPPVKSGNFVGEYQVALNTAGAILAALYCREETGVGQHIDISKQEIILYLCAPELQDFPQWGMITDRLTRNFNFGGPFPCQDGYIYFSLLGREHRAAFFQMVGYPEVEQRLMSRRYLDDHAQEVGKEVRERLAQRTKQDIWSSPLARQCPLGPFLSVDEVVNSPQMQARGFLEAIDHPETGPLMYPASPYHFSLTPYRVERPAPRLGQHNEEIFCGWLGCSHQELQQLKERGIV